MGECVGFVESVVLAVKACFYETDMKQIVIEKGDDRQPDIRVD